MKKIFFSILCLVIMGGSYTANAKEYTVYILETMTINGIQNRTKFVMDHLNELAKETGDTFHFDVGDAEADMQKAESLLDAYLKKKTPDLVISIATLATKAVHKKLQNTDIPYFFLFVSDPVRYGFAPEMGKVSKFNMTGISHAIPPEAKLDLVKKVVLSNPKLKKINVTLYYSDYPSSVAEMNHFVAYDNQESFITIETVKIPFRKEGVKLSDVTNCIKAKKTNNNHFYIVAMGPNAHDGEVLKLIEEVTGEPYLLGSGFNFAKSNALMGVASNINSETASLANHIMSVLKGKKANAIPVTIHNELDISINLTLSEELKIAIPADLLEIAQDNLYREKTNATSD